MTTQTTPAAPSDRQDGSATEPWRDRRLDPVVRLVGYARVARGAGESATVVALPLRLVGPEREVDHTRRLVTDVRVFTPGTHPAEPGVRHENDHEEVSVG